jgi:methionyl-tRNA synthetase
MFCEHDNRFLPDRYVEGECPYCHSSGARGDQCDSCGKLLDALNLVNPQCKICGKKPVIRETTHWFLDLPACADDLKNWLENKPNWKDNVKKFILSWIDEGLIERSITRDIDWGVPVPVSGGENKVLYVWFDAPIGYITSTIEWAARIGQPDKWKEYWLDPETRLVHFIGKDNIPFHAIIWPAILMGQPEGFCLPYDIPANEYLNLEGRKISTSNNFAIWVEEFVHCIDGELLRFALAANAPESKDADFTLTDFQNQVNNSLANVLGNLANRVFSFTLKNFNGVLLKSDSEFIQTIYPICDDLHISYSEFKVRKAVKTIIDMAREGNRYFDESKPWVVVKEDLQSAENILFACVELLRVISIVFYPIMPASMIRLRKMMGLGEKIEWSDIKNTPDTFTIGDIERLFTKIEDNQIEEQRVKLGL